MVNGRVLYILPAYLNLKIERKFFHLFLFLLDSGWRLFCGFGGQISASSRTIGSCLLVSFIVFFQLAFKNVR